MVASSRFAHVCCPPASSHGLVGRKRGQSEAACGSRPPSCGSQSALEDAKANVSVLGCSLVPLRRPECLSGIRLRAQQSGRIPVPLGLPRFTRDRIRRRKRVGDGPTRCFLHDLRAAYTVITSGHACHKCSIFFFFSRHGKPSALGFAYPTLFQKSASFKVNIIFSDCGGRNFMQSVRV